MSRHDALPMWTIYDHPADRPDCFVARLFLVTKAGIARTDRTVEAASLKAVRRMLPPGLHRWPRAPSDSPSVVETWA